MRGESEEVEGRKRERGKDKYIINNNRFLCSSLTKVSWFLIHPKDKGDGSKVML